MKLNTKITLFSAVLATTMVAVLTVVSLLSFRQFSIISAEEHIRSSAEIVRVALTESMVNGTINKRENFLSRLTDVQGLRSTRVIRGPRVEQQFGKGLGREQPADDLERKVLTDGKAYFALEDGGAEPIFRGTIPFVANRSGNPNCLQCHIVPDGTVLGAVTLTMSISHLKKNALIVSAVMVGAVAIFTLIMLFFFRRLVKPMIVTARDVRDTVERAIEGDYRANIAQRTSDEIGEVALDLNNFMKFLHSGLTDIGRNVAQLLKQESSAKGNLLTSTTEMVQGLIDAAHFKQAIEEDEAKIEIYHRLSRVLQERFKIEHFSIYEVVPSKNKMTPIVVDGEMDADIRWCDPQILVRSDACRARRTGHLIDSVDSPGICYAFHSSDEGSCHVCFPIIQSGAVGSVLQLVVGCGEKERVQKLVPYVSVYLREAAPVLEAKRLMETLHQSSLSDAMTGLHNRRFLEEYIDTLIATTQRRQSQVSLLMLDLDYFKMVNDSYGHDAGDTVLKTISKVFTQTVRSSDIVIRYGGEEFLIILQDTLESASDMVAEKIRATVEALKIQLPGGMLQKTISIGISEYPKDSPTFWQAVKYADVALYRAKEEGRNRVVRFLPEMWQDDKEY